MGSGRYGPSLSAQPQFHKTVMYQM